MSDANKKSFSTYLMHSCIGVAIMLFVRYLPLSLPEVTSTGMEVLGIFIGTLYLWTTVDPAWSSLICISMLGFSTYGTMNSVLSEAFGSPVVTQTLFMMILAGAMIENRVTQYIARFFLTRKIIEGRPWVFTYVIMIGCFLMSAYVGPFAPIFLFWPVIYDIFKEVGYKKGDLYTRIAVTLVIMATLLGFPVPPFMSNGLALLGNYRNLTNNEVFISDMGYMFLCLIYGFTAMAALVLFSKYVLRPDIGPLKKVSVDMMKKNPLPPLNTNQKILSTGFILLVVFLLVPSLFTHIPIMQYIFNSTFGLPMLVVGLLAAFRLNNEPIVNLPKLMGSQVNWASYFMIVAAILIGNALTSDITGIGACLNFVLSPLFQNMPPIVFYICILMAACILTNLCNSLVIGMLLQPVIVTYCITTGADHAPIVALMICFVLSSAALIPAASPFAALLHGNREWLQKGDAYKFSAMFIAIEAVIIVVLGIPLARILL